MFSFFGKMTKEVSSFLSKIETIFLPFSEDELITPPLSDGLILPGVTRDSLISIAKSWNEFKVTERYPTMEDIKRGLDEKRVSFMSLKTYLNVFFCDLDLSNLWCRYRLCRFTRWSNFI